MDCKIELFEIYALRDPITKEIRYIGKAKDSLKRFKSHLNEKRRSHYPLYRWINSLKEKGLIPILEVIKKTNNWIQDEIDTIKSELEKGTKLLNIAKGGDQPYCDYKTRAENGRKNMKEITSDPKKKKLWLLKKRMGQNLKFLKKNGYIDTHNRIVDKCHKMAQNYPDLVWSWMQLKHI